mgnify:FL=1
MNKFDFVTYPDKFNKGYLKFDSLKEDELPLSIADMDFLICPKIYEALKERLDLKTYGYVSIDSSFYQAYIDYYKTKYDFDISSSSMSFSLGVLPSLSSIIKTLSLPNDFIATLTPAYNCFFNEIRNNGRKVIEVPLFLKENNFEIDFNLLESSFKKAKIFILCNPHNPSGKVFSKEELIKIASLAKKYQVFVISDEIHSPIVRKGIPFYPFLSVSNDAKEVGITLFSVTKGWNLASIQTSLVFSFNKESMEKIEIGLNRDDVNEPNLLSIPASKAALSSLSWLEEANEVIFSNKDFACFYIKKNIPRLIAHNGDSTYLLWIDISKLNMDSNEFSLLLRKESGLIVSSGLVYGDSNFIRINVALPRKKLIDALDRLKKCCDLIK